MRAFIKQSISKHISYNSNREPSPELRKQLKTEQGSEWNISSSKRRSSCTVVVVYLNAINNINEIFDDEVF